MARPSFGCRRRTSVLSTSSFAMRAARSGNRSGGMQQIDRGWRGRRATTRSLLARPRSKPGRAPRAEPPHHTIMRHARAFRCPARSTIEFCNLVGVCLPGRAVKGRKLGDQFGDGHAELGCSGLEHVRSVLVDLDADVGVHGTRIADPETAGSILVRPTNAVRFQLAVVASPTASC